MEEQYRQHFLDTLRNPRNVEILQMRLKVINHIRRFLEEQGLVEHKPPMMSMAVGQAARFPDPPPNVPDMQQFLQLAEISLASLVAGGSGSLSCFKIGTHFTNEVLDLTHERIGVPQEAQFHTCEFILACKDYDDAMQLTENMLSGMIKKLTGGYKIMYQGLEIDFTPPFKRIDMIDELEKKANLNIPKDLSSNEANQYLLEACLNRNIDCPPPRTTALLLDKLTGHYIGGVCTNPTFIMHHLAIMSPKAKEHTSKPGLTESVDLFINRNSVCKAYTMLTDPVVQRQRFTVGEAMDLEQQLHLATLELGLPPAAACGLVIDHLLTLLTDSQDT